MDNQKGCLLVIGVLLIVALVGLGIVWVVQNSVQETVAPVQAMTGNLGTEVAKILHPTPTILPDPVTIIHSVRSLARLETIQYTLEKVIRAENGSGPLALLFGDKLLFVAHGKVIAGVDLEKLGPENLEIKNGVLYVALPEPEIFVTALDNDKSYVYDRETGLLTKGDINLEAEVRQVAEQEIMKAALEDGILEQARKNAEAYLYRLFNQLGFREIIFSRVGATPVP
jgi:hypothetical protein